MRLQNTPRAADYRQGVRLHPFEVEPHETLGALRSKEHKLTDLS